MLRDTCLGRPSHIPAHDLVTMGSNATTGYTLPLALRAFLLVCWLLPPPLPLGVHCAVVRNDEPTGVTYQYGHTDSVHRTWRNLARGRASNELSHAVWHPGTVPGARMTKPSHTKIVDVVSARQIELQQWTKGCSLGSLDTLVRSVITPNIVHTELNVRLEPLSTECMIQARFHVNFHGLNEVLLEKMRVCSASLSTCAFMDAFKSFLGAGASGEPLSPAKDMPSECMYNKISQVSGLVLQNTSSLLVSFGASSCASVDISQFVAASSHGDLASVIVSLRATAPAERTSDQTLCWTMPSLSGPDWVPTLRQSSTLSSAVLNIVLGLEQDHVHDHHNHSVYRRGKRASSEQCRKRLIAVPREKILHIAGIRLISSSALLSYCSGECDYRHSTHTNHDILAKAAGMIRRPAVAKCIPTGYNTVRWWILRNVRHPNGYFYTIYRAQIDVAGCSCSIS